MRKKIMIVEDHEEIQYLYKMMFRRVPDLEIIAQEYTAEKAIEVIPAVKPDLMIIDITLPGMSGIQLTTVVRRLYPEIKTLLITAHDTDRYADEAKDAGADSLLTKDSMPAIVERVRLLVA